MKKITYEYIKLLGISSMTFVLLVFSFYQQINNIGILKRISNSIHSPKKENGSLRILSMTTAYDMISSRPLLGCGYGNYSSMVYDKYVPLLKKTGNEYRIQSTMVILGSTFNPYLQILAESGIIGLVIYLWFLRRLYYVAKYAIQQKCSEFRLYIECISGWLLVFFLSCLSANWFLPASFNLLLIFSLIGICLAIKKINNQEVTNV
jgi:O-antigen ligase